MFYLVQSLIAQSYFYQYHYLTYYNKDTLKIAIQDISGKGSIQYYLHKGTISKDGKYLIGFLVDKKSKQELELESTEDRGKIIQPNFKDMILVIYSLDKNEIVWKEKVISNAVFEFVQDNLVWISFSNKEYLLDLNNIEIGTLINSSNAIMAFDNKIFKIVGEKNNIILYEYCNEEKIFKQWFKYSFKDQNSSKRVVAIRNENVFLTSKTSNGKTELLKINNEVTDTIIISDRIDISQENNFIFIASTDYSKKTFNIIQFDINGKKMETILTYSIYGPIDLLSVKKIKDNVLFFLEFPLGDKRILLFNKMTSRIEEIVSSKYIDKPFGIVEK